MKNPDPSPMFIRFLLASLFLLLSAGLFSQETGTCAEKLKNAQSYFDKGQVEEVPNLLKDCLKSGFKKEEELTAYKLLIQTYLLNDKLEQADSTMFEFLRKNPEYQLSPTDHSSFVYLFSNFKVKPTAQVSVHAGINVPFLTFVNPDLTAGETEISKFKSNINFFLSAESRFKIADKTEMGFEVGFSLLKFTNKIPDYNGYTSIIYTESQQRIEVPVFVQHDFKSFGKFTLYGRGGVGASYTLGVTANATNTPTDPNNKANGRTGESLSRKDSRIKIDCFAQLGGGLKYKISKGFLFAEIRSDIGILDQNVPGGQTIPQTDFFYAWRDPSFRLNAVNINVGYTYIFYKPTKRKE
jgi:hypothetical protein